MKRSSFLEMNNLHNKNHGFRSGRSRLSQLLELHQRIINIMETGSIADVIYLGDFAKVFDKVDHGILMKKLIKIGESGWQHAHMVG